VLRKRGFYRYSPERSKDRSKRRHAALLQSCLCGVHGWKWNKQARGLKGFKMEIPNEYRLRPPASAFRRCSGYNEEATLSEIVARLLAVPEAEEIVIVDDCSTDGTRAITDRLAAEHPRIRVVHHAANAGKTEALKTGFALTTGQIVIVQDADLEYDPAEIGFVIAPIVEGHADVVYGSRFLVRKRRACCTSTLSRQQRADVSSNLCTNVNMDDVEPVTGVSREIIRNMTITSSGLASRLKSRRKWPNSVSHL